MIAKSQPAVSRCLLYTLLLLLVTLPLIAAADADFQVADEKKTIVRLSFLGDCVIGSEEKSRKREDSIHGFIQREGYAWPFSGVRRLLDEDDLTIVNFEGVLKDDTRHKTENRLHWFRGPTDFAQVLTHGGVELAGLGNNHAKDYGNQGLNSTRLALKEAGIHTFGYEELRTVQVRGILLGFGGIRETTWRHHPELLEDEIGRLKKAGCDYIIYTIHAGKEYSRQQNELQTTLARQAVDAGADLVVGTHPHVVQGIERYRDGLILYSLGNFVFGGNLRLKEFEGLIARVELRFEGRELTDTGLRLIPVLTTGSRPDNDFRPVVAQGEDRLAILGHVQAATKELDVLGRMDFPARKAQRTQNAELEEET